MNRKYFTQSALDLIILCILFSCNTTKHNSINWDKIEHHITSEIIHTNDPYIRGLFSPVVIDDYVITRYFRSEKMFSLSHLRNDSLIYIGDFLSDGRGPSEMSIPTLIYIASSKQIVIYDNYSESGRVFYIDATNIKNVFNIKTWDQKSISYIKDCYRLCPLTDSSFLGLLPLNSRTEQMFFYIDSNGLRGLNLLFPNDNSGVTNLHAKRTAYLGNIQKHPIQNRFVYFSDRNRYMHIFDFTQDALLTVSTPYTDYPRYSIGESPIRIRTHPDSYHGPINFFVTDKHIYALMNDATYAHIRDDIPINGHPWTFSNTVFVFDWNGIPIKKYILDRYVQSFFIDSEELYIYGNRETDKSIEVFRYKIK